MMTSNHRFGERRPLDDEGAGIRRPSKQPKLCDGASSNDAAASNDAVADETSVLAPITLPPEVWAKVMNYMDYASVLSCAAASKSILREAMPLMTALHIDKASQLNSLISRFRDIREVNIFSLLKELRAGSRYVEVDHISVMKVVPLLTRLPNLEQAFLGGRRPNGEVIEFSSKGLLWSSPEDPKRVHSLMDMISCSFHIGGVLPEYLRVLGLGCPGSRSRGVSSCQVCQRACQSFPVESVVNFENQGSFNTKRTAFWSKRKHCLDVCLARSEIESIIESRPGGRALLRSNARFISLLGRGRRHEIYSNDGTPLYVVRFGRCELHELERVIEHSGLNAKNVSREDVTNAIMRSFAKDYRGPTPPRGRCFLVGTSFRYLKDRMGLSIRDEDFLYPALNMNNLPQVVKAVMNGDRSLQYECVMLLYKFLEMKTKPPVQQIVDLGVIPKLVELLQVKYMGMQQEIAAFALGEIARKGTKAHTRAVVDAGAIPALIQLLSLEDRDVAKPSMFALRMVAKTATFRDKVLQAGVVASLLTQATKLGDPLLMKDNLSTLTTLSTGKHFHTCAEVIPCLGPLSRLLSDDDAEVLRYACWTLLMLSEYSKKRQETIIGAGAFSRLLQLLSHSSCNVHEPALRLVGILVQADESQTYLILRNGSFPSLISRMRSPVERIKSAAWCVWEIMTNTRSQLKLFVIEGCIQDLCSLLTSSYSSRVRITALVLLEKMLESVGSNELIHHEAGIKVISRREIQLIENKMSELKTLSNRWRGKDVVKAYMDALGAQLARISRDILL